MKTLKKISPFIIISIFFLFIYNFYQNNLDDFLFLTNVTFINILSIAVLCLFYLITETLILKNIIKFFNSDSKFNECFLVICTTYLCNTFIQFSGLGYRAFYLKKIKNIEVNKFIILSLFIIAIELFIFSSLSFILLLLFDITNNKIDIYFIIYLILIIITFLALIFIFLNIRIINFLFKFELFKNIKIFSNLFNYFLIFDLKKLKLFILKFSYLFIAQFFLLFLIFFLSTDVVELDNSILFSVVATMSTDLSFIFTITPYAIGISETLIFFSSNNFDIKFSEILYITNIFRLSMFIVYSFFGIVNLYWSSKKLF